MKGIEELECTTVARWSILKFIRNIVACSIIHYPGVSHRTFGFPALSNERHEVDTVHAAIEPNIESNKQKIFELKKIECFIFE